MQATLDLPLLSTYQLFWGQNALSFVESWHIFLHLLCFCWSLNPMHGFPPESYLFRKLSLPQSRDRLCILCAQKGVEHGSLAVQQVFFLLIYFICVTNSFRKKKVVGREKQTVLFLKLGIIWVQVSMSRVLPMLRS